MPSDLVEFWRKYYPLDGPPYVHPDDRDYFEHHPRLQKRFRKTTDFEGFVRDPKFDTSKLCVSLRPVPYSGDLEQAKIFVLLLNPGLGFSDFWGDHNSPLLVQRLEQTLYQRLEDREFPFMWLDPNLCWHGGFAWWEKKLREVINTIAIHRFNKDYRAALAAVSNRIAAIQLAPYHSFLSGADSLTRGLPSVSCALQFVKQELVPRALDQKLTLIATRQVQTWNLPQESDNIIRYGSGQARTASLTSKSDGGKAILRLFDLSEKDVTHLVPEE